MDLMTTEQIVKEKVNNNYYLNFNMQDWKTLLLPEANVYVYNNSYIAKRFDNINFEFCGEQEAQSILKDNLYALLRFKYFKIQDDTIDKLITKIIIHCTENIKTLLSRVAFPWERSVNAKNVKEIPAHCVAFRNGVYDFKNNKWLIKILETPLDKINNVMYSYNTDYIILWYVDIDFQDLQIPVTKWSVDNVVELFKSSFEDTNNLGFGLIHNMSFNEYHEFNASKFSHLCQILGYTLSTQFIQNFIMFIGNGSNGKNSLLDGCFSSMVHPRPVSISLDTIEEDRFVTGALENKYHNFYLETENKVYSKSEVLKQLTGSTAQTIEQKGKDKRTGFLNVKHIFSGNHREDIKFGDSTKGFARRINLFEVFYEWDNRGDYLKLGDYLPVNLSQDLRELKKSDINTLTYIYLGMWGAAQATNNFTTPFYFTKNEFNIKYESIDVNIKSFLTSFNLDALIDILLQDKSETFIYLDQQRLTSHPNFKKYYKHLKKDEWRECVNDIGTFIELLNESEIYLNVGMLWKYSKLNFKIHTFTKELQKFTKQELVSLYNNKKYVKVSLIGQRIKFIK